MNTVNIVSSPEYGIRILPLYVTSLVKSQANIDSIARSEHLVKLDMDAITEAAWNFTKKNAPCFKAATKQAWSRTGDELVSADSLLWEMEQRSEVE